MLRNIAGSMVAIVLTASAGLARAEARPMPPAPAPVLTRQALYDKAQAAFDRRDWPAAIAGFSLVLVGANPASRSTGVIRGQLARALLYRGRIDEARAAATQAITEIRQAATGPDADLAETYLTLADACRFELDLDPAIAAYGQARALATGPGAAMLILTADIGVIHSNMVTHPDLAARTAEALIADQVAFKALTEHDRALILTLRARAELNRGDLNKARDYSAKAVALSGGMQTTRVSLNQITIRSDAGLIAALRHDEAGMHEYFAFAGAGHLPNDDLFAGASVDLPVCGPDISPDDSAVIEFAIGDDGHTVGAAPVYASHPGQMGVAFARAVRTWRWRAESAIKLNGFWRSSIRMQLRCLTTPLPIEMEEPFADTTTAWLRASGIEPRLLEAGAVADSGPAPTAASSEMAQVGELFRRLKSKYTDGRGRSAAATELDALLVKIGAPPEVRAYALVISLGGSERGLDRGAAAGRARALAAAEAGFDAMPHGERSAAWLRTEQAIALEYSGNFAQARPPLDWVVALPPSSLPSDDPIRRVAIIHLSLLDRAAGREDVARARLTAAGLTSDQCSLLDVRPLPRNTAVSSAAFPEEAMRWHFEGWVREAFDIRPDGAVARVRTVVAYPPYVFGPASEGVVANFRYLPPTLGDKVLGCAGQTLNIHYRMPD